MKAAWLSQDPMLRALPRWLVWSLATTLLLMGLAVNLSLYVQRVHGHELGSVVSASAFGLVLWLPAVILLLSRGSRTRCSPFDLSLPLTTQHLWLRHLIASALSGALLMLAIAGIAALVMSLLARYTDTTLPVTSGELLRLAATLVVLFVLTATLIQATRPAQALLPGSRAFAARSFLVAMGTFVLAVLWMQLPLILLVVPALATYLLARWARLRLPATWSLESEWGETPATPLQGSWEGPPASGLTWRGSSWQLFLLRAIHSGTPKAGMTLWVGVPLLLGFGAILSGAFIYMGDEEIRWSMLFISIYMVFALYAKPLAYLHPLDALPISRRHLFALLTLPSLLVLGLGYGAGRLLVDWKGPGSTSGIRALQTCAGVGVPTEFHSISWNGAVEPVVVSRFCTRDSNVSMEFQVFQAGLAAEALYGAAPAQDAIRRFLEGDRDSTAAAAPRQLEVEGAPRIPGEAGVFPVIMALVCMGSFGCLGLYLRTFRVGRLDRLRKLVFVGTLVILLTLHMGQFVLFALRFTSLWAWDVFWKIGTRSLAAALPGGIPTLWILACMVSLVTYRLAERQFERAELPRAAGKARC